MEKLLKKAILILLAFYVGGLARLHAETVTLMGNEIYTLVPVSGIKNVRCLPGRGLLGRPAVDLSSFKVIRVKSTLRKLKKQKAQIDRELKLHPSGALRSKKARIKKKMTRWKNAATSCATSSLSSAYSSAGSVSSLSSSGSISSASSQPRFQAGDYRFSLRHGGLDRGYELHVPASLASNQPVPVVLAFHGGGGNIHHMRSMTQLDRKADTAGFLAVYPEGTGIGGSYTWNAGLCCGYARDNAVDDVGFVRAVLEDLKTKGAVDSKRVYATGFSNGALISYRLACEASDLFAAIAPVSAHDTFDECLPSSPISIMHIHGTADMLALYDGSKEYWNPATRSFVYRDCGFLVPWVCRSVPDYVNAFRALFGCGEETILYQQGGVTCSMTSHCSLNHEDSDIVLCTAVGAGHSWPGSPLVDSDGKDLYGNWGGVVTQDLDATDAIWDFFVQHPKP